MRNAPKKATQSVSSEAIAVEISRLTVATDVQVYFCDPRSPWQRGSNENTNGLLRQYFPKGTDLSSISQAHLNKILGFESPADRLNAVLQ
jgi:IS30 family transposase